MKPKYLVVVGWIFVWTLALLISPNALTRDVKGIITIQVDNPSKARHAIESRFEVDVLGGNAKNKTLDFYGGDETLQLLRSLGYKPTFRKVPKRGQEIQGFKNLTTIESDLRALARSFPKQAKVISLMEEFGVDKTAEGREILAMRLSDQVATRQDRPRIAFIANHHAREIQTPEIILDLAHWLLESDDARAKEWLSRYEIWLVPVVNPDGYDYVFSGDSMWRKNRAMGGQGVDLNRNYPFRWAGCGSVSDDPDSDVYAGPAAASEPEVRAMMALSQREKFWISVSYHSYGKEVLYPYVCATMAEGEIALRDQIVDEFRQSMGFDKRTASAEGEDFEWRYNQVGGLSYLVEVSWEFQPGYSDFVRDEIPAIRNGWMYLFGKLNGPVVTGKITDSKIGLPLEASLQIVEINFRESEKRSSDIETGRYFWFLRPGTYNLRVEKKGYAAQTVPITVSEGQTPAVDISLVPL